MARRNPSGLKCLLMRWIRPDSLANELSFAESEVQMPGLSFEWNVSSIPILGDSPACQEETDDSSKRYC